MLFFNLCDTISGSVVMPFLAIAVVYQEYILRILGI